ncbi:MAG: dUTP diphosphatase [Candidatus Cloacimonadota bacterium]|nr:MAG: dUTP diphosphatase [Candidatus Cloacimonadota bacterium]PIE77655.1 MAG: dUTP diphosphatase [Candidatus Delongbacteria bacterium]
MISLKVLKLDKEAYLPEKKDEMDAGWDLRALEDTVIPKNSTVGVATGISIEYPEGYWGQIEGRSGMALKGIFPTGGIIDNGYRGEHRVILVNLSGRDYHILKGDKIAQLVLRKHFISEVIEVESLGSTKRGDKGFGSSGR